ncbi:unnamed protein product, partial [Mesorhabditis belari]|uniref:Alpha-galactosidase n=1 Tax=Mesorhabditis belari TaxID=2138241 RepID=A0AAF3F4Q9_9BILA
MILKVSILSLLFTKLSLINGLENGLARTPPMGWMSWAAFMCEIDCEKRPHECISERLYVTMADQMVKDGFRDAGYTSVHIDDCWMEKQRDSKEKLVADRARFPSGIRKLAQMMHDRNLKLGIYEDYGSATCAGYPGSKGYVETDAKTFEEWDTDYLKFDGCNVDVTEVIDGFKSMKRALSKRTKKMVYSCEWPLYLRVNNHTDWINYTDIAENCNMWRNFDDVYPSWSSILAIIDFYVENQDELAKAQGPGAWNDPDMILVGNESLTYEMAKSQMSIWCIWSAPLLISVDLRILKAEYREILLNRKAIAIDQDPMGKFGKMVQKDGDVRVFLKTIHPIDPLTNETSYAIAVFNKNPKQEKYHQFTLASLGIKSSLGKLKVEEIWSKKVLGIVEIDATIQVKTNPAGTLLFTANIVKNLENYIS